EQQEQKAISSYKCCHLVIEQSQRGYTIPIGIDDLGGDILHIIMAFAAVLRSRLMRRAMPRWTIKLITAFHRVLTEISFYFFQQYLFVLFYTTSRSFHIGIILSKKTEKNNMHLVPTILVLKMLQIR
ncbi:hypothetical protein ACJX0J_014347, partial [Zea mays]